MLDCLIKTTNNRSADYKELWELRDQNQDLSSANQFLKDELQNRGQLLVQVIRLLQSEVA